mgnify:CR=1 FL=1
MDVRQLAAIVAIADHGTFSAAARSLYTVQSNVSGHISRLEKELGVTLVDRSQSELTEEGARVVERARRVLNEMEDITSDVSSRHDNVAGQTRIGVIGTTARWLTPSLLRQLATDHPNVRAVIREGASSSLVPNVMSGELNAAVIHLPIDEPELVVEPLFAEDLFLLVAGFFLTGAVTPEHLEGMMSVGRHYAEAAGWSAMLRGIPAGFLIAVLVWMLPLSKGFELFVVMIFTFLIAAGDFTHVVAGAVEVFMLVLTGELGLFAGVGTLILPTLIGNIVGGTVIFALLAYAQVQEEIAPDDGS